MTSSSNQYFTMNMNTTMSPAWQPQALLNNNMLQDSKNGSQIMKYNSMESINASGNNPYYGADTNQSTANIPHLYPSLQSETKGYNSDLKQDFLKSQRIKARMVSPAIPTDKF